MISIKEVKCPKCSADIEVFVRDGKTVGDSEMCIRDSADTAASSDAPAQTADNSAAAAAGEVWKCTQTLNTPSGYSGGPVRLEPVSYTHLWYLRQKEPSL